MHKIFKIFLALVLAVLMTVEIFPVNTVRAEEEAPVTETAEPADTAAEEENQDNEEAIEEVTEAPAQTEEETLEAEVVLEIGEPAEAEEPEITAEPLTKKDFETSEVGEALRNVEEEEYAKVILDVSSELENGDVTTVTAKVYPNYDVKAVLPYAYVSPSNVTVALTMNDVASLGITGTRTHSITLRTNIDHADVRLASQLDQLYAFTGAKVNATVKDGDTSKSASWTLVGEDTADGNRTITGDTDEAEARAAWLFLAEQPTHFEFDTQTNDDSYFLIKKGSTLQIGSELLEVQNDLTLNSFNKLENLFKNILDNTGLTKGLTDKKVTFTLKKGAKLAVGNSTALLKKDVRVTLTNAAIEEELEGTLGNLQEGAHSDDPAGSLVYQIVGLINTVAEKAEESNEDIGVLIEFLDDYIFLAGHSVNLDGMISIRYVLEVPEGFDLEGYTAELHFNVLEKDKNDELWSDKEDIIYDLSETENIYGNTYGEITFRDGNQINLYYPDICSGQMTEPVTLKIYKEDEDGNKVQQSFIRKKTGLLMDQDDYSIRDYAIDVFNNPNNQQSEEGRKKIALMEAMLTYGEMAQTVFNYNIANDETHALYGLDDLRSRMEEEMAAITADTLNTDLDMVLPAGDTLYKGLSVELRGETTLYIYFKQKPDSVKFNNKDLEIIKRNGYDAVGIRNIACGELSTMYNVEVNGTTYKVSALSYANKAIRNNTDPARVNLMKAMCLYSEAANDYKPYFQ